MQVNKKGLYKTHNGAVVNMDQIPLNPTSVRYGYRLTDGQIFRVYLNGQILRREKHNYDLTEYIGKIKDHPEYFL